MTDGKIVNIDFFTRDTLPPRLEATAKGQDVQLGPGLVVVKTKIGPPLSYDFESVGTSPEEILDYMRKLAEQDGVDLGEAVKRAFSEGVKD